MEFRVITGGQTGVDRGVLDACLAAGVNCGGFCPRGRLAEDGTIPERYPMRELETGEYERRTRANVEASDAVVILTRSVPLSPGSRLTENTAVRLRKPVAVVALGGAWLPADVASFVRRHCEGVLMVVGPRESKEPGIAAEARAFFAKVIEELRRGGE